MLVWKGRGGVVRGGLRVGGGLVREGGGGVLMAGGGGRR